jgi:predicted RNase H-like HicB family nuclease
MAYDAVVREDRSESKGARVKVQLASIAESEYELIVNPEALTNSTLMYVAHHPEIPGLRAHGDTPEAAIESHPEGFAIYEEDTLSDGFDMPLP